MDKPSLKKTIIASIYSAMLADELASADLVLFTSCGIFAGRPVPREEWPVHLPCGLVSYIAATAKDDFSNGGAFDPFSDGDSGYIVLRDVKVLSSLDGSAIIRYDEGVYFFSDIIGYSVHPAVTLGQDPGLRLIKSARRRDNGENPDRG